MAEAHTVVSGFEGLNNEALSRALYFLAGFPSTIPHSKSFSYAGPTQFAANNWPLAIGIVCAYMLFITVGSKVMAQREKPFDLRLALAAWNAFLCIFSFLGMWGTMPYLLAEIVSKPYDQTVCTNPTESWGNGTVGLWVMLFIYSKIPELIDTVFIVLRKRPLIFLHWYHHVTVLLFCWSSYSTLAGSGLYFVAMNYSVHALMYGYYCLQALRMCPKSFPAVLITLSQIAQMFVGTGVCISCWYYKLIGLDCHNDTSNLIAGALMYGSYLYLFCDFAVRRYVFPQKKAKFTLKETQCGGIRMQTSATAKTIRSGSETGARAGAGAVNSDQNALPRTPSSRRLSEEADLFDFVLDMGFSRTSYLSLDTLQKVYGLVDRKKTT